MIAEVKRIGRKRGAESLMDIFLADFRAVSGAQPTRDRRTRRTVDLPLATHRALDIWQREAADRIGAARVTGQEVLIALIDQLLADPKLSSQITRAIQARR